MTPTTIRLTIALQTREVAVRDVHQDGRCLMTTSYVGLYSRGKAEPIGFFVEFRRDEATGTYRTVHTQTLAGRKGWCLSGWHKDAAIMEAGR